MYITGCNYCHYYFLYLNKIGADFKQTYMFKIESCIGFHSFSHVYVFFYYCPSFVNLSIRRGVKPLPITNY